MSLGKITKFPNFTNLLKFFIVEEKRSLRHSAVSSSRLGKACEQTLLSLRSVGFHKVFWVTFLQKRDGTRFLRQLIPQFGLEASNLVGGNGLESLARGVAGDGVAHNLLWAYAL